MEKYDMLDALRRMITSSHVKSSLEERTEILNKKHDEGDFTEEQYSEDVLELLYTYYIEKGYIPEKKVLEEIPEFKVHLHPLLQNPISKYYINNREALMDFGFFFKLVDDEYILYRTLKSSVKEVIAAPAIYTKSLMKDYYYRYTLSQGNNQTRRKLPKKTQIMSHKLIYFWHNDGWSGDSIIDHIDGDKTNNKIYNLEAIPQKLNGDRGRLVKKLITQTAFQLSDGTPDRDKIREEVLKQLPYTGVQQNKEKKVMPNLEKFYH